MIYALKWDPEYSLSFHNNVTGLEERSVESPSPNYWPAGFSHEKWYIYIFWIQKFDYSITLFILYSNVI